MRNPGNWQGYLAAAQCRNTQQPKIFFAATSCSITTKMSDFAATEILMMLQM